MISLRGVVALVCPEIAPLKHPAGMRVCSRNRSLMPATTLVLWRNRVLVNERTREPIALASDDAIVAGIAAFENFVDLDPERDAFERVPRTIGDAPVRFVDPIFELGRASAEVRPALVRALAIARWSATTRFCAVCGAALVWKRPGSVKICVGAEAHEHWARIDPSAIMLVSDGERMLLGRQPGWPEGMYSTLAGFVERGESVEECVAREVFEEAGITVGRITYFGSEPWPFPRSLMLGFFAEALTSEIVRGDELEDVRWFTIDEGLALQRHLSERMPFADTIARRLIAAWLRERSAPAV